MHEIWVQAPNGNGGWEDKYLTALESPTQAIELARRLKDMTGGWNVWIEGLE